MWVPAPLLLPIGGSFHAGDPPAGWAAVLLLAGAAGYVVVRLLPGTALARLRALDRSAPLEGPDDRGPAAPAPGRGARGRVSALVRGRRLPFLDRDAERRRRAVIELARGLAAELRAGRAPAAALASAIADTHPSAATELAPVAAAARSGEDPASALRAAAVLPGAAGLRHLAACWQVSAGTGAGLADVVDRLAETMSQEEDRRRQLAAHLAGPRTTALLLSVLPIAGLVMASLLGGRPLAFLFGTPLGLACLAAGVALDLLGLYWTDRMVRGAVASVEPGDGR
ncbi:tight adherence protein B [Nocardiopsis mwathae]|uniref:Tight adherence protein B n=1 Tax=Nocardiopsis mwathae TaxID=1472723 RepID=A0A7W9YL39_9ACTN|nr:type II secretion system F family protein [Nocardiopsis mwathae]MBB6174158.1 tight adherence protein B [Nocardiopsis mwathae]